MNQGLKSGTNKPVWTDWYPRMICVGTGGEVQPINDGTELRNLGRWTYISPTTVLAEFHLSYSYWIERGTGKAYGVELPIPAKRWYGDKNSTNHPLIGRGYALRALANPAPVFPLCATLMETTWTSGKSHEEYNKFCHVWLEKMIDWQSGTWNANTQTKTINHLLDYTPDPLDFEMQMTSATTGAYNNSPIIVDNATSTSIDFHYPNAPAVYTNIVGNASAMTATAARYIGPTSVVAAFGTTFAGVGDNIVIPGNAQTYTIDSFYVEQDTPIGAGSTRTYVVSKNNADTALTLTIAGAAQVANSDTTHSFTVTSGDQIAIKTTADAATSTGLIRWSIRASATTNVNMSCCGGSAGAVSNAATNYIPIQSYYQNAAANTVTQVMPNSGTFQNARCVLTNSPGAGTSYAFTLYKNGSPTAITFTIADTATTGSDTTHTVSYVQGDQFYWECVPTGTPAARSPFLSLESVPTTPGDSVHLQTSGTVWLNSAVRYEATSHPASSGHGTTEAGRQVISQAATWKNLTVYTATATGAAKTYDIVPMVEGAQGNQTVQITNASLTGTDNTNTDVLTAGQSISIRFTPAGTPASTLGGVSFVSNITSYTLPTANVTYKYRGNGWANSSGGLSSQLVNPKHPWPWNIVEGLFMHLIYEVDN